MGSPGAHPAHSQHCTHGPKCRCNPLAYLQISPHTRTSTTWRGLRNFVVPPDSQHPSQAGWSVLLWHSRHHTTLISAHGTCQDTHRDNVTCLLMGLAVTEPLLVQCQQCVSPIFGWSSRSCWSICRPTYVSFIGVSFRWYTCSPLSSGPSVFFRGTLTLLNIMYAVPAVAEILNSFVSMPLLHSTSPFHSCHPTVWVTDFVKMREHVAIPLTSDPANASGIAKQMNFLPCKKSQAQSSSAVQVYQNSNRRQINHCTREKTWNNPERSINGILYEYFLNHTYF